MFYIFVIMATAIATVIGLIMDSRSTKKNHTYDSLSQNENDTFHLPPIEEVETPTNTITYHINLSMSAKMEEVTYEPLTLPDISNRIRFRSYIVKGINPKTKRNKTKTVILPDSSSEEDIIAATGLIAPAVISINTDDYYLEAPPSDNQKDLLKKYNIPFSPTYTQADIDCLIDKQLCCDSKDLASESLRIRLAKEKVYTSPYCGTRNAVRALWESASDENKLFFWCYLIYCSLVSEEIKNPDDSEYSDTFRSFSEECFKNSPYIAETISTLTDFELNRYLHPEKKLDHRYKATKAYEYTKEYLISKGIIPK